MRYSYDISTKDKEILYANLVDQYLFELGFGLNKNGTKYMRDLILTAYFMNDYCFEVSVTAEKFINMNKIDITKKNYIRLIQYDIKNINYKKMKENFYSIFEIQYDFRYLTPKNLIILFINKLSRCEL